MKPGEKIPTDGVIVDGHTSVNEAMLTGESKPVEKAKGAAVIGGSVNGEAAITVEVTKTGDETYDVAGTLTIRGVAKEITLPVTYLGTAKDPWGNDYTYKVSGRRFEIISLGADGKEGGTGVDTDLSNEGTEPKK